MKARIITSDISLNPALRKKVSELRGGMQGVAEQQPLPEHFTVQNVENSPSVLITNTLNGRTYEAPLFAYREIRKALSELCQMEVV